MKEENKTMKEAEEDINLDEIYAFALDVSKKAGQMLLDSARKRMVPGAALQTTDEKDSSVDIVTETDVEIEQFIKTSITTQYPSHQFLGEETYSKGSNKTYLINDSPTWVIDPLDGTVNYTHLFPMVCISIAFLHNSHPVVGVIAAPFLSTTWSAAKSRGAWYSSPIHPDPIKLPLLQPPPPLPANAPKGCIFSCEWGKDRRDIPEGNLYRKASTFLNMAAETGSRDGKGGMAHGIRSLGSAALDLAYTATGSFDIWWEGGCWEWDVAAGIVILEEAGGLVVNGTPTHEEERGGGIQKVRLGGRKYLGIRPARDAQGETAREAQERVVRSVWERVVGLEYSRPGVEGP